MTLRVGIAGTGFIARIHAAAVQATPGAQLSAVVARDPVKGQAFASEFSDPRSYADVPALLKDGQVDALVVCTANVAHLPQSLAALEAGVAVLVEKPMAMNTAEAETDPRSQPPYACTPYGGALLAFRPRSAVAARPGG